MGSIAEWVAEKTKTLSKERWYTKVWVWLIIAFAVGIQAATYYLKQQEADKAKLKNVLVEDDKKDIEYSIKSKELEAKAAEHLQAAKTHTNTATAIETSVKGVQKAATSDKELINSIGSWADLDQKVKPKS